LGAVLAAGAGSRFGAPKADLVVDGERLLDRAIATLGAGGCDHVVAVVRPGTAADRADRVRLLVNEDPDRGQRSSLEIAVAAAGLDACEVLIVVLVDTPGLDPAAVRSVLGAWRPGRIVVGCYDGRRGHPVAMAPELWRQAVEAAGPDEGAKRFLGAHPELVDEVAVSGERTDIDTPADLARWQVSRTSRTPGTRPD
jgi:molybdenum cofactor cytidylyltransferase/nicotine blue oxidoreductase